MQAVAVRIDFVVWLPSVIEKLDVKHGVAIEEVEQVFRLGPAFRRGPRGRRRGENLYLAYGQTEAGRYLFVVFILKANRRALVLSARDMTESERRMYRKD